MVKVMDHNLYIKRSGGNIWRINLSLLGSSWFFFVAYSIWPTSSRWWGLGFFSICLALAATALLINAMRKMTELYQRDKALAAFMQQGAQPKSSTLATSDALDQAGMRE